MRNKQINIVVIGNIIKETIRFPDKVLGPVLGSPAAYSSLVIAALDKDVGLVTHYGRDMENGLIEQLDIVDSTGFIKCEYSTTNILVYEEDGCKHVEYVRKAPPIKFPDIPQEYLKSDCFYICPMDYEVGTEVIKQLYEMGKTVTVDLGGYGGATSYNHYSINDGTGRRLIKDICEYSTIIKASEEDLKHIAPGLSVEQVADYFIGNGAKICVITLGSKGAFYKIAGEKEVYVEPSNALNPPKDIKFDFTGAGDSFGAGLVTSYYESKDIKEAVRFGNAVASLVIENTGGCTLSRMPSYQKVMSRIKETNINLRR